MRVVVVGTSGAGKTSMAAAVASALALPHIELDRLHLEPNWEALSQTNPDEFVRCQFPHGKRPENRNLRPDLPVSPMVATKIRGLRPGRTR